MSTRMYDLLVDDTGATIIEYGLILALISAAVTALGSSIGEAFNSLADSLQCSASPQSAGCVS